jgi:hypothetical protein
VQISIAGPNPSYGGEARVHPLHLRGIRQVLVFKNIKKVYHPSIGYGSPTMRDVATRGLLT